MCARSRLENQFVETLFLQQLESSGSTASAWVFGGQFHGEPPATVRAMAGPRRRGARLGRAAEAAPAQGAGTSDPAADAAPIGLLMGRNFVTY